VIRVILAGIRGRVGQGLADAISRETDVTVVAGVSRSSNSSGNIPILSLDEALRVGADVFVDYTRADAVRSHVMAALSKGLHVVIGTSGLTPSDFDDIDRLARERQVGVFAAGNFSLTAALLQTFALTAAKVLPQWEIVDYSYDKKPDAPSGTTRELAERLAAVRSPERSVALEQTLGSRDARGALVAGSTVHSLRLPGFVSSCEIIFGTGHERLSLRHDSIDATLPYVQGTLLAIRRVSTFVGLKRGLDNILPLFQCTRCASPVP
jgi:4-hydroxy-tetrahydrodipicolinate reductase